VPSPKAELVLDKAAPVLEKGQPLKNLAHRYWRGRRLLDPGFQGGPGSVLVEGLVPGQSYEVLASAEGVPRFVAGRLRTLRPPEGRLLSRFATVSDMHIGEPHFGLIGRIHDALETGSESLSEPGTSDLSATRPEPYPVRGLRAALEEAAAWGAELIVAKGDLTNRTTPAEVRDAGRLLASSPVPVEAVLGNHDNNTRVNVRSLLAHEGLAVPWQPWARDLEGIRLVFVNTAHAESRYHRGQLPLSVARQVARLAAEPGKPAWLTLHHPPEKWPFPTVYPPGTPFGEGRALVALLAEAGLQGNCFISCGHRHRNRYYRYGPVVVTEVGSTKDYPGVWAGYKVFEGGILQVVRRTRRPDVLAWTEATRRAMNGQWGRWSPGSLADRCIVYRWGT